MTWCAISHALEGLLLLDRDTGMSMWTCKQFGGTRRENRFVSKLNFNTFRSSSLSFIVATLCPNPISHRLTFVTPTHRVHMCLWPCWIYYHFLKCLSNPLDNRQDIKTMRLADLRWAMAILFQDYYFPLSVSPVPLSSHSPR